MAAVPQRDSKPELIVRHIVHSLGYRYRLHRRDLPGTPDLVLSRLRKLRPRGPESKKSRGIGLRRAIRVVCLQ